MHAKPQEQHEWLARLVGRWAIEMEAAMGPGEPAKTCHGEESVRRLGDLWIVCEGGGETPDGGRAETLMTLGYDPGKEHFVGTFIASVMAQLWVYENGELDAKANALCLLADGPSMSGEGMATYKDVITLEGKDRRTLASHVQGPDGSWTPFMTARYRRIG